MSQHLLREVEQLKHRVVSLAAMVEKSIRQAVRALFERNRDLALEVIERDRQIDQTEVEIEEECLKTLALYQPVASDLRFIIAVLKVNNDLERIGDLAKNIAERAAQILECGRFDIPAALEDMSRKTEFMLRSSLDALINLDIAGAKRIRGLDDEVDELNRSLFRSLQQQMHETPDRIEGLMQLISVSRYLERIADHATNIAEDVIYLVKGTIARHHRATTTRIERAEEAPS